MQTSDLTTPTITSALVLVHSSLAYLGLPHASRSLSLIADPKTEFELKRGRL